MRKVLRARETNNRIDKKERQQSAPPVIIRSIRKPESKKNPQKKPPNINAVDEGIFFSFIIILLKARVHL